MYHKDHDFIDAFFAISLFFIIFKQYTSRDNHDLYYFDNFRLKHNNTDKSVLSFSPPQHRNLESSIYSDLDTYYVDSKYGSILIFDVDHFIL